MQALHGKILRILSTVLLVLIALGTVRTLHAQEAAQLEQHGPKAPGSAFPSHVFQLKAHAPETAQLSFHYGLTQPIVLRGFNAAVDVRYRRFVFTYSHGQGLDFTHLAGVRSRAEKAAGVSVFVPYSTGFGIGLTLIDELYVLADFKLHRFEVRVDSDKQEYFTITTGAELGWRFFLWKGLHIAPVIRYWPTVWASKDKLTLDSDTGPIVHHRVKQGFALGGLFVNILVGWAFDL